MFYGNYPASVDEKGRVHIPSALAREVGKNKTVMIADWGKCLAAFPAAAFEEMGRRLLEQSANKEHRERVHRIVSSFFPGEIKNGKLLIPPGLREKKKTNKKVAIVGMLKHIEIWDHDAWIENESGLRKTGVRDDLDELGIL